MLAREISGNEDRILALLFVAFRKPIGPAVVDALERAHAVWRQGKIEEASARIAAIGLAPLVSEDSTRGLHIAAGLLDSGFLTVVDLVKITQNEAVPPSSLKTYNPDQPRVAAGNVDGGQWTAEGAEVGSVLRPDVKHDRGSHADQLALILPGGCDEEWAAAFKTCTDLFLMPNPPKSLTGGHTTLEGCAKGFVSQHCGGNSV